MSVLFNFIVFNVLTGPYYIKIFQLHHTATLKKSCVAAVNWTSDFYHQSRTTLFPTHFLKSLNRIIL